MNSADLFYQKIEILKKELRDLKTAHIKTATTISTMAIQNTINLSLMLDRLSGNVYSSKRAIITMNSTDGSNMVSACYLAGVTPTSIDNRFIEIQRLGFDSGIARFGVAVTAGNEQDFATLYNGGSVDLTYNIEVVGSSIFTTTVEYVDITGGTI